MVKELPDDLVFPGLHEHELVPGIAWTFYKHWGQSYLAGEGKEERGGDHSGGLVIVEGMRMTDAPCVAQARVYTSVQGYLSAVYSYPNGIGAVDEYFWEIWNSALLDEPERYATEQEMEQRIIELLGTGEE